MGKLTVWSPWMKCLAIVVVIGFVSYLVCDPVLRERYQNECQIKQCVQNCTDAHGSGNWGEQALQGCLNRCNYVEPFYNSVGMPDPDFMKLLNHPRPDYVPTRPIEAFEEKATKKVGKKMPPPKMPVGKKVEGFEEENLSSSVQKSKEAERNSNKKVNQYAGTYNTLLTLAQKNKKS